MVGVVENKANSARPAKLELFASWGWVAGWLAGWLVGDVENKANSEHLSCSLSWDLTYISNPSLV